MGLVTALDLKQQREAIKFLWDTAVSQKLDSIKKGMKDVTKQICNIFNLSSSSTKFPTRENSLRLTSNQSQTLIYLSFNEVKNSIQHVYEHSIHLQV